MSDFKKRFEINEQDYISKEMKKWNEAQKSIAKAEIDRQNPKLTVPSDDRIIALHGAKCPTEIYNEAPKIAHAKTTREMKEIQRKEAREKIRKRKERKAERELSRSRRGGRGRTLER